MIFVLLRDLSTTPVFVCKYMFLCSFLSICNETQGLRANHEHNQNTHISRSAVYQDNIVAMVPSPTSWSAMRGRAGLSAAEGGIWVHRLTATATYFAADSRNNKSNSTPCNQTQFHRIRSPSSTWQLHSGHLQGSTFQLWSLRSLELGGLKSAHCWNCSAGPMNILYYWLLTNI